MGISVRIYVFQADGEIKRVPQRTRDGLILGEDAIPEYAGTRQKIAHVVLDNEASKPTRIMDARGYYWTFDEGGTIREDLIQGALDAMDTHDAAARAARAKVVDLRPQIKRKEWEKRTRWDLSGDDLDRIAADIWPRLTRNASDIRSVRGKAPKRPPLTRDAELAIGEVDGAIFSIILQLQKLSEPALKGFAYEARRHAAMMEGDSAVWDAVALFADQRREIKSRHRTGKGTWFAVCRIDHWEEDRTVARTIEKLHRQCDGKEAAEEAAREFLRDHAHRFNANVTVEVEVLTDLEWSSNSNHEAGGDAA